MGPKEERSCQEGKRMVAGLKKHYYSDTKLKGMIRDSSLLGCCYHVSKLLRTQGFLEQVL